MQDLQEELGLTYLFISHDLSVVKHLSNRIAVMYLGKIVELCDADGLFDNPVHPYTKALLSAIPIPTIGEKPKRILLHGDVPQPPRTRLPGCRFHTRCPYATERCRTEEPCLREVGERPYGCLPPGGVIPVFIARRARCAPSGSLCVCAPSGVLRESLPG